MLRNKLFTGLSRAAILGTIIFGVSASAHAQSNGNTQNSQYQQLETVLPNPQMLQGFVSMQPAGEVYQLPQWSAAEHKMVPSISEPEVLPDGFSPSIELKKTFGVDGTASRITCRLYSADGNYALGIQLVDCDSASTAQGYIESFRHQSQAFTVPGSTQSKSQIGDESWVDASTNGDTKLAGWLMVRVGRLVMMVGGDTSNYGRQHAFYKRFPASALDAVAYQILLLTSQQTALTGVPAQNAHMAVNGHALPKNALLVAGQTYVPVAEFAKAMGLTTQWNIKTGALTLSGTGHKTVTLTADSTAATVGGAKSALTVPVLKQAGQPVMTLTDLLAVTGGRVVGRSGDMVKIKG